MTVDAKIELPVIEFRSSDLERGTNGWHQLCKKVREACETFGCFEVVYDTISTEVREEMFRLMKELVEVPVERKQKNILPPPSPGWVGPGSHVSPLYEGFGLGDVSNYDSVKNFAELMWPEGHPRFCDTAHTMGTQLEVLNKLIWLMLIDSYGLGDDSLKMNYTTFMRMMKYMPPPPGENEIGFFAHTDKLVSTLICENQIPGLEIEVNDGQWIRMTNLSPSSFVFVVGDALMAWSNGRLKAAKHRVLIKGDKDRFSMAAFILPNKGTIIKIPKELIDEQHPRIFKDLDFMEFYSLAFSDPTKSRDSGQLLHKFAALSPPVSN
ncbi:hypothetical protein F383_30224 [Gossypium arboreum]|uniref:Uncharacterized protein n=2 Tax=Gossypium arboreum TaxID=29729 RepID=A0A0B0P9H1_GOSAR|nr:probable 2-oxoglutarate-dependent dioxygenase AOP1 [Gossypium arboreum]KAK5773319.1 hypothetical protein PVK06_049625 [Gossypium arboreum]KHG23333.1 hypothetical protein F383_30224 [Gossypium arboreum]